MSNKDEYCKDDELSSIEMLYSRFFVPFSTFISDSLHRGFEVNHRTGNLSHKFFKRDSKWSKLYSYVIKAP